jgi:hypothetical protein
MEPKIETHNNPESVETANNKANLNNQQISQTENRAIFSKGEASKNLKYHKPLSKREATYFSQYNELYDKFKDVDDSNKKAILNILSEDYKNMTSEEKSHVPEYFLKIFEGTNKSSRNGQAQSASSDKIPIETSSLRSPLGTATGAKIVGQVKINGQRFDRVECGGGGDCCFRSIAEALGIGSDNYKIVRELLSKKMIEAADSEEELPETIRLALSGVYDGLNSDDDNMCKKALKHHAQNITAKNGRWGYQLDVLFVPQLTGKNVFIGANAEGKDYSFDGFDAKFKGLIENSIPEEGDVILYNVGKGHWQMLKPMEKSLSNKI